MGPATEGRRSLSDSLARFVGTGAYTGHAPWAPGTVGTLPGVAVALGLARLAELGTALYLLALAAVIAVAVWAAGRCQTIYGRKDPSQVVADEIAGFAVTMAFLPMTVSTVVAGFLAFRLFDVWKPAPARQAEALPGGTGVVLDDLVAGVYAQLLVRLLLWSGFL